MKVHRGPASKDIIEETDSREPDEYIEEWKSGNKIFFNVSKNAISNFSTAAVEICEPDIVKLFNGLVERNREERQRLLAELDCERRKNDALMDRLHQIWRLSLFDRGKAPSNDALLNAIHSIANSVNSDIPKIDWLD